MTGVQTCALPIYGRNLEFEGVKPDVYVKTGFHDKIKNSDPQLDKALELIMKDLGGK